MTEIVSGVLKLAFGFLSKKIRKEIAERLQDGDVTDEECRRLIVRELDDIRSKLDGLARKDLLSSLYFLQDGVNRLYQSLLQPPSHGNTVDLTLRAASLEITSSMNAGPRDSPVNDAIALITAIDSLKVHSKERFKSAVESFKLAHQKATEAFSNEALSIEDRIQASQIRMMARILESLEDPDAGVSDCLQYLKQLHDIGAIREIFSVLVAEGIKSWFNQSERLNHATSVHVMNQILYDFSQQFTQSPPKTFEWPMILLGKRVFHPVFGELSLLKKLKNSGVEFRSPSPDVKFDEMVSPVCSVVNGKGEIVAKMLGEKTLKIFNDQGESRVLCADVIRKDSPGRVSVLAIDIDVDDNIYVITAFQQSDDEVCQFTLLVLDSDGNMKLECPLPSFSTRKVSMAINERREIAILDFGEKVLYIGKVFVESNSYMIEKNLDLKELSSERTRPHSARLRFLHSNGTKIIVLDFETIYMYTEDGKLERKIKIPEEYGIGRSLAISRPSKRILVQTSRFYNEAARLRFCGSLLSFSESGELIDSVCLGLTKWVERASLTSHWNDNVALLGFTGPVFLRKS